jgi:hypothetical protein
VSAVFASRWPRVSASGRHSVELQRHLAVILKRRRWVLSLYYYKYNNNNNIIIIIIIIIVIIIVIVLVLWELAMTAEVVQVDFNYSSF